LRFELRGAGLFLGIRRAREPEEFGGVHLGLTHDRNGIFVRICCSRVIKKNSNCLL